jgi:nucleotide-binding universal stress UspA family protein
MPHVLAALDDSAAAGPVLAVARWFGEIAGLDVVALHVCENGSGRCAQATAAAAHVEFEMRAGAPVTTLCDAAASPEVRTVALGARGIPAQRVPAGHVALDLVRRVEKPVIVVPPDAHLPAKGRFRLLAPIDPEPESSAALCELLAAVQPPTLELVLLRVFDAEHMPAFENHGTHDADLWVEELVRATVPAEAPRARVELRVGHPASTILDAERELAPDAVVLAWAQTFAGGHAIVVERLIAEARTPLVLLPVAAVRTRHPMARAAR